MIAVPIESIALNTYFGVELGVVEEPVAVARSICLTANEVKTLFHRLEVLDVISVGGRRFVRCRTDLLNPYPMLDLLFARGRAIIASREGGYVATFSNDRHGPVPNMMMHSTPRPGQRVTYRGPKVRLWQRQFE